MVSTWRSSTEWNLYSHRCAFHLDTFIDLADKVFCLLLPYKWVDCVADTCRALSVKVPRRTRRGQPGTFILKGPATRIPKEWTIFVYNNENKINLLELISSEWKKKKNAPKLFGLEVLVTAGITCAKLTSRDVETVESQVLEDLGYTQEEANTASARLAVRDHRTQTYFCSCIVSIAGEVFFDTGVEGHRRIIQITDLSETHGSRCCETLSGLFPPGCGFTS